MNKKELFWISLTIFFTMVAWMILDLYRIKNVDNFKKNSTTNLVVMTTLDDKVIRVLETKEF